VPSNRGKRSGSSKLQFLECPRSTFSASVSSQEVSIARERGRGERERERGGGAEKDKWMVHKLAIQPSISRTCDPISFMQTVNSNNI
jgi:hypothetical protein